MNTMHKIIIILYALLILNVPAFCRKKNFLKSLQKIHGSRHAAGIKHRVGTKRIINSLPNTIQPAVVKQSAPTANTPNTNKDTNHQILAQIYGGLGQGIASVDNLDYANGLNSKIQATGGYGLPNGIYSYAFDPKTGMPFMCDPTKKPPAGVSQVNTVGSITPPATTGPVTQPAAATTAQNTPFQADKSADQTTTPSKDTPNNAPPVNAPPVKVPHMNKILDKTYDEQSPTPNNDGVTSTPTRENNLNKNDDDIMLSLGNKNVNNGVSNVGKVGMTSSGATNSLGTGVSNNVGKGVSNGGKVGMTSGTTNSLGTGVSNNVGKGVSNSVSTAANNALNSEGETPTPSIAINPSTTVGQTNVKQSGTTSQNLQGGSAVGTPIHATPSESISQGNGAPSINTNPASKVQGKNPSGLTKLIAGKHIKVAKKDNVNIKLPEIPPCPDLSNYHWPWNCLDQGKGTVKKECIEAAKQMFPYDSTYSSSNLEAATYAYNQQESLYPYSNGQYYDNYNYK